MIISITINLDGHGLFTGLTSNHTLIYYGINTLIMQNIDFEYTQEQLHEIADGILKQAKALGATDAQIEISEGIETCVDILNQDIDNFESYYNSTLCLTVYIGKNKGSVGVSQTSIKNLEPIILHALDIAKYTQPDDANGVADSQYIQNLPHSCVNLQLHNPSNISHEDLIARTKELEQVTLDLNPESVRSDGSSITLGNYSFVAAASNGFNQGYKTTRFSNSISIIADCGDRMQTDYWYSAARCFNKLESSEQIAQTVTRRLARRLDRGQITSGTYPVIFESPIAKGLVSNFLSAISGNSLYRKLSFLNDSLNTQVFPEWFNILEDPFIVEGLSSCYFDNEGISVAKRNLVKDGVVGGYLLSSYSARKLGLTPTGNAGGYHNILVKSNFDGGLNKLIQQMDKGIVIIETIGHGVNMVTGDYSVGASGLWVENGEVQFFVDNITISGNLKTIFKNIQYINSESYNSSIMCGSMLISNISVSS